MSAQQTVASVRLAELIAMLSLATDLGRGHPIEQCLRRTRIALRLGDLVGLDDEGRAATYYAGLLVNAYCHADAHEQALWFGDDIAAKASTYEHDPASPRALLGGARRIGAGLPPLARAGRIATFPLRGYREVNAFLDTHSRLASEFTDRIGLGDTAVAAVRQSYERWDGRGEPAHLQGEHISLAARLIAVADIAEVYNRRGGVAAATEVVRTRSGGALDPGLADRFCAHADELLAGLEEPSSWDAFQGVEPEPRRAVRGADLDDVLEAVADLVDLKSPYTTGHSRGVASLAAAAGRRAGLPAADVDVLRRAGLLHDIGRLGVSNAIWDHAGPLTEAQWERVRLHPYLSGRMIGRVPALAGIGALAARHHERLDGSGYPGGLTAGALMPADRVLAAADVYHALTEPRPHRPARSGEEAAATLREEARAGRLDGDAVQSVLAAAGHRAPARRDWPRGLTAREVEVLGLLARGHSNKEIARRLVVTPRTVATHVEHIYAKVGVSTRAAATLFAMQHGLVGSFEAG